MAVIYQTTLTPTKLELLSGWLPAQPWYAGEDRPELAKAGGFRLDDPAGEVGIAGAWSQDPPRTGTEAAGLAARSPQAGQNGSPGPEYVNPAGDPRAS